MNVNVLEILSQVDGWMSECEILEQVKCSPELLASVLDTLARYRFVDDSIDEKFEQSYRLTNLGRSQLNRSRSERKLSSSPPSLAAG